MFRAQDMQSLMESPETKTFEYSKNVKWKIQRALARTPIFIWDQLIQVDTKISHQTVQRPTWGAAACAWTQGRPDEADLVPVAPQLLSINSIMMNSVTPKQMAGHC